MANWGLSSARFRSDAPSADWFPSLPPSTFPRDANLNPPHVHRYNTFHSTCILIAPYLLCTMIKRWAAAQVGRKAWLLRVQDFIVRTKPLHRSENSAQKATFLLSVLSNHRRHDSWLRSSGCWWGRCRPVCHSSILEWRTGMIVACIYRCLVGLSLGAQRSTLLVGWGSTYIQPGDGTARYSETPLSKMWILAPAFMYYYLPTCKSDTFFFVLFLQHHGGLVYAGQEGPYPRLCKPKCDERRANDIACRNSPLQCRLQ
jgi:hypothetical protein